MGGYVLEWLRDDQVLRMLVCDLILADCPEVLTSLFGAAVDHALANGLRGVVVENAGPYGEHFQRASGLLKSPRAMVAAIRSRQAIKPEPASFLCDVK